MLRLLRLSLVTLPLLLASAGGVLAIQLLGDTAGRTFGYNSSRTAGEPRSGAGQTQVKNKDGAMPSTPEGGAEIWIPGIGVVGKMPRMDFGLEMLYGEEPGSTDQTPDRSDFEDVDPEFSIKGTIKKKF